MKYYIFLQVWTILFIVVRNDLPVHCMKHQIIGEWVVQMSKVELIGSAPLTCGHAVPDNYQTSFLAMQNEFKAIKEFKVLLYQNNSIYNQERSKKIGFWTMVYDEGFHLKIQDYTFFAFSKYYKINGDWASKCDETLIGWFYHKSTQEKGCYKAHKINVKPLLPHISKHVGIVALQLNTESNNFFITEEFMNKYIENLLKSELKWKPKIYQQWQGLTFQQINRRGGNPKFKKTQEVVLMEIESSKKKQFVDYSNFALEDVSHLPKSYSWKKYTSPARNQGNCGSCYSISTMAMLSSRLRIKGYNVTLSPQYSVDCNYYNQGCDGGYPFLVNKFAHEQNLVTEEVYPYKAQVKECQRKEVLLNSKEIYSVKNYYYVGGFYGNATEKSIMEEIYYHGPVVMNFEPSFDFMFYGGGVYHSIKAAQWIINEKERPEWEKVDHSVLCVGWGEDLGEKYWLLQNSWGTDWGEDGFFRIRRGTDDSGIESMSEAAHPFLLSKISQENKKKQ